MDLILQQITSTRSFILHSLAADFSTTPDQIQWTIFAIFAYLILLTMVVKVHRLVAKSAKNRLKQYTLNYDTILMECQKQSYLQGGALDCSWIKEIIESGSYLSKHALLMDKIALFDQTPDLEKPHKGLLREFRKYKKANRFQKLLGGLATLVSLGIYKIFA